MNAKKIRIIGAALVMLVWLVATGLAWFLPAKASSEAERRALEQMPELTLENIQSGHFMKKFNEYALDQFPGRDSFRTLKTAFHKYVMQYRDNNELYTTDGFIVKQESLLNKESVDYAVQSMQFVYDRYLKDKAANVYMTVVPDKHFYAAQTTGRPVMDYAALFEAVQDGTPWATYIDITDRLTLDSYYYTDTHWRQEKLIPVAQKITAAMGVTAPKAENFYRTKLEKPFYGVYYGQAALPVEPELDTIQFLHSNAIDKYILHDYNTVNGRPVQKEVYDMTQLDSQDLYDVYLGGARRGVMMIENPKGTPGKELVIFRDSYGSSIAPLLVSDYAKVTVLDIREVDPRNPMFYFNCNNKDVLFMFSTLVLNNSAELNNGYANQN